MNRKEEFNETIRQLLKRKPMTARKLAQIIASKTGQRNTVVMELVLKELRNIATRKTFGNGLILYKLK